MHKLVTTGEMLIKKNQAPAAAVMPQQPSQDLASQLTSLNDLFQSGILSEDEFNSAKAKILGT